jgi:hypothetical protein
MPTSNLIKINRRFCPDGLMPMCKFFIHEPVRRTYFPVSLGVQWAQVSVLVKFMQQGQLDGVHSRNWGQPGVAPAVCTNFQQLLAQG